MSVHVCIASDHLAPNLLFHRQYATDSTIILQSATMRESAKRFANLLKGEGHPCIAVAISDNDPSQWVNQLLEIAPSLEGSDVWLNLTGGNKLMALVVHATLQSLLQEELRAIYVDTDHDQLHLIQQGAISHEPLTAKLNLKEHLRLYDLYVRNAPEDLDAGYQRAAGAMARACSSQKFQDWLGNLNRVASELLALYDKDRSDAAELSLGRVPPIEVEPILKILANEHIAQWIPERNELFLRGSEREHRHAALRWLGGGWIEQWAGAELRNAGLDEVIVSASIEHGPPAVGGGSQVKNEIDVVAYHRNRLMLLECKTANPKEAEKQSNILYKLDSLRTLAGGPLGQGVLVSARTVSAADLARAERERIKVFHGAGITGLADFARAWKGGRASA